VALSTRSLARRRFTGILLYVSLWHFAGEILMIFHSWIVWSRAYWLILIRRVSSIILKRHASRSLQFLLLPDSGLLSFEGYKYAKKRKVFRSKTLLVL